MTAVKDLFAKFLHVGHRTSSWNPKMKSYLHGDVNGVHVFDLEKTVESLDGVKKFLTASKLKNAKILFVGTKPQTSLLLQQKIQNGEHFYIDNKWQPGLLTNFNEIRKRIDFYLNLKSQFETGEINKYTKKEIAAYKKDLEKLEKMYSGVTEMRQKPDVLIVLDSVVDRLAIEEAAVAGLAIIAVADSNANPDKIDYLVPANDDSVDSLEFLIDYFLGCLKK